MHAATRAGAMDERGREALLKYVRRPPIAQERIARGPEGPIRIVLEKRFSDGTDAIDLDPLSLLTRLCASVPPARLHTAPPTPPLPALGHAPNIVLERRTRYALRSLVDFTSGQVERV